MLLACLFLSWFFITDFESSTIMLALSWLEIKQKTMHCQGENSSNVIHKMYKEKIIK